MHYPADKNTTDEQSAHEHSDDTTELAKPCGQCGAEAYEACRDHCTALG